MRSLSKLVAVVAPALLVMGCRSSAPAATNGRIAVSAADRIPAFPAERTATLWVNGIACPY